MYFWGVKCVKRQNQRDKRLRPMRYECVNHLLSTPCALFLLTIIYITATYTTTILEVCIAVLKWCILPY
jgi:hypothetical protein